MYISLYIYISISISISSHTCWRITTVQLEKNWCTGWRKIRLWCHTTVTHFFALVLLRSFTTRGFKTLRWSSSFLKFCLLDPRIARTDNSVSCSPFPSTLNGCVVSILAGHPCHKLYCKFTCSYWNTLTPDWPCATYKVVYIPSYTQSSSYLHDIMKLCLHCTYQPGHQSSCQRSASGRAMWWASLWSDALAPLPWAIYPDS